MQNGTVVEQGSHSALYADEASVYHSLVRLQEQATEKHDEMAAPLDFEAAIAADEAEAEAAAAAAREAGAAPEVQGSGRQTGSARQTGGSDVGGGALAYSRKSLERSGAGEAKSAKEIVEQAKDADEDELVRALADIVTSVCVRHPVRMDIMFLHACAHLCW